MAESANFSLDIENIDVPRDGFDIAALNPNKADDYTHIANQISAGAGEAFAGVANAENANRHENEKKEKKRRDAAQVALTVNQQKLQLQKEIQGIQKQIEQINIRLGELDTLIEQTKTDLIDLKEERTELKARIEKFEQDGILGQNAQIVMEAKDIADKAIEALPEKIREALDPILEIEKEFITVTTALPGDEVRLHVVHQEDGRHFIIHPGTDEKVYIDQLENSDFLEKDIQLQMLYEGEYKKTFANEADDAQKELLENFEPARDHYLKVTNQATRDYIIDSQMALKTARIQLQEIGDGYTDTKKQLTEVEQKIEELENKLRSYEGEKSDLKNQKAELEARLNELTQKLDELENIQKELTETTQQEIKQKESFIKHSENFDETYRKYEGDRDKLIEVIGDEKTVDILIALRKATDTRDQAIADQEQVLDHAEVITKATEQYEDRHAQLQEAYGGRISTALKAFGFDGTWSAKFYGLVRAGSEIVEAWKSPIQHDGLDVYRDNETGELYTYDKENDIRNDIQDPVAITELYRQAYDELKLFKNETPYSEDPNNTYEQTHEAILDAAQAKQVIADQKDKAGKNVEKAQKDVEDVEHKLAHAHGKSFSQIARMCEDRGHTHSTMPAARGEGAGITSKVFAEAVKHEEQPKPAMPAENKEPEHNDQGIEAALSKSV